MLTETRVRNFRCIADAVLSFTPGINALCGVNGSGKTSFLEVVSICANGKSFRTNTLRECVRKGSDGFSLTLENDRHILQTFLLHKNVRRLLIGEHRPERLSQYININTVLVLSPEDIDLVAHSSGMRRKFIDRGVFEQHPEYLSTLSYLHRILKNRNALLRQKDHSTLPYWNDLLCQYALQIHEYRKKYTQQLQLSVNSIISQMDYPKGISITYINSGDDEYTDTQAFLRALEKKYSDEKRYGYTLIGPHKDEITVTIDELSAGKYASYGQQKMVAMIMKLAQAELIQQHQKEPVLLVDDLAAGLDAAALKRVAAILQSYQQVILTTIEGENLPLEFGQVVRL